MRSTKLIGLVLVLTVILLVLYINTPAGGIAEDVSFGIETVAGEGGFTDFEKMVIEKFEKTMRKHGYNISEDPDIKLIFSAYQHENDLIVSVFSMYSLPEPIIKWGSKQEVFYLGMGKDEKQNEELDHSVRQYMSGEYLRQFGSVFDSFVVAKPADKFDELMEEIVDRISPDRLTKSGK